MKRRNLLSYAGLGLAGTALAGGTHPSQATAQSSPSSTPASIRWQMATSWSKTTTLSFEGVEFFCRRVSEMTAGNFSITPYEAGELAAGFEVLDVVQAGTVECGHTTGIYYIDRNPALAFSTGLPFGLTPQQQLAWLYYGGGLELLTPLHQELGIVQLTAGNTGAQMGGWFKQPVDTIGDLQGLKMRIPGLGSEVMKRLGVNVQVLPVEEIIPALIAGDIEAVEWRGPYEDEQLGLHKATNYYYYPGWWEPGSSLDFYVNREAWETLPREYQEILKTTAIETDAYVLAQYNAVNGQALQRLKSQGIQVLPYSSEILETAHRTAFDLYEELATADPVFRQIYEPWLDFRSRVYQWHQVNELSFANFTLKAESSS